MEYTNTASAICKRHQALKSDRLPYEMTYRDCYNHSHPMRAGGWGGEQFSIHTAKTKTADLLDTTSTDSAAILASSIVNGTTPSNTIWFELDAGQETEEEKRYLDDAAKIIWQNIHSANFDSTVFEATLDLVDCGYFCLYVEEAEGGGYKFELWHTSECFFASSKRNGPVDIVHREYELTAEQCVDQFGDSVSDKVRRLATDKPDEKVRLVHAIYPRKVSVVNAKRSINLPVASVHLEYENKHVLRESGYHELPVIVPRWHVIPGSSYAVGQIFHVLPAIKELNQVKKMELEALEMAVRGIWIGVDDGVLNPRTVRLGSRKLIMASSTDAIKSIAPATDFNVTFVKEEKLQAEIKRGMMADQMPPVDGQPRTATEFYARIGFLRQLLGPVFGRYSSEFLQPLIARCFGLAYRAGALGQAPQSLQDRNYIVKYLSPLARSQKLEEVAAVERLYSTAGVIAQTTQNVSIFDNLDDDESLRITADALGVPNSIVRQKTEVSKVREEKQQQASDMQQQAAIANIAGQVIPDAAKTMINKSMEAA